MQRHLSTLSILHYVYGAFVCLSGLAALVIILVGGFLSSDLLNEATDGERIPAFVGVLVQSLGWVILVVVEVWGVMNMLSGSWIANRRNRTGSQVVAAFNCLNIPFGLALGIFTFMALGDDAVKQEYQGGTPAYR
ncbi:MAG: hypothetical protein IPN62_16080 [Flavobacteriales bacterium]|jgi:hypothetical protein|nr:hypothetical protein [Flavobacteriales bacterium]